MGKVFKIVAKSQGRTRREYVDIKRNPIYAGATSPQSVKRAYESFWSLNKYEPKVKVISVTPSKIKSRGANFGIMFLKKRQRGL